MGFLMCIEGKVVTIIITFRFTSNHGRQEILLKNFSSFGDFPWEVGVLIFYEMWHKVFSFSWFAIDDFLVHGQVKGCCIVAWEGLPSAHRDFVPPIALDWHRCSFCTLIRSSWTILNVMEPFVLQLIALCSLFCILAFNIGLSSRVPHRTWLNSRVSSSSAADSFLN